MLKKKKKSERAKRKKKKNQLKNETWVPPEECHECGNTNPAKFEKIGGHEDMFQCECGHPDNGGKQKMKNQTKEEEEFHDLTRPSPGHVDLHSAYNRTLRSPGWEKALKELRDITAQFPTVSQRREKDQRIIGVYIPRLDIEKDFYLPMDGELGHIFHRQMIEWVKTGEITEEDMDMVIYVVMNGQHIQVAE